ncbi:MAG: hypothetical protein JO316_02675 [Abitibacteriaceae bacterium]|nr:hypothetical protein [Abditibacteriaceae bacterium]
MSAADTSSVTFASPTPVVIRPTHNVPRSVYGLRLRALLVGIPLLVGICLISVYADMVSKTVQFGVLQLAPPAVASLFAIAFFNRGLSRLLKREWLSQADILVIYAMLLVGVMVSTRGVVEKVIPPLAYLPYYATRENQFNELITQHLPKWAVPFVPSAGVQPPPEAMRQFFEGLRSGQPIPFTVWFGPLLNWFALVGCVIFVFACLATLLRRQWMDNEQLRFPLTTLPLAIIRDEVEGQPFFSNRVMWMGFAFSAIVFGLNGLQANNPLWPRFVLDLDINGLLTERPWNQIDYTHIYISLAAIGFGFFLPTDLLFSLWFFFVLSRLQDVGAVLMGGMPTPIGTHNARVWTGYQAAGAYIVLVLAQLRIGLPYYKQVWRTAFGKEKLLDDSSELMSYRTAIIGLIAGFGGIVLWLSLAGMNPLLAVAQMGIYMFFVALIMSRAVCEAGLLMTETSFLPAHLISLVCPQMSVLGPTNLSLMGLMNVVFARDLRGVLLSPMMDDQKMAGELRVKPRSLLLPLGLAVVIAFVSASFFMLYFSYTKGHLSLYDYPTKGNAANMLNQTHAMIKGDLQPPDATAYGGFAVGILVTIILVYMRGNFTWFPLHPLAYAITPNWAMIVFWFPFLIAWIIKSIVMRFGGIQTFRRIAPFMLGMILGEFSMAMFWAVGKMVFNWSAPDFPWP